MSIEYTIDIQLTEMGFPEIFHPQEGSVAEAPSNSPPSSDSLSLNESSVPVSNEPRQTDRSQQPTEELGKEAYTLETPHTKTTPSSLKTSDLAQGTETKNSPPAQSEAIKETGLITSEQAEGDDSDDSDVSYEEVEVEEEEDFCEEEEEEEECANVGDYQCNVCNLQCPSMFKLQDHMHLHTGARPYSCAECGKRFSQIYNYRVHLRTHAEAKLKQPKCRICLKRFAKEGDLKYHLSTNHFEDQFYECDRCKRVFSSLQACEHHIQHTCMQKVVCEKCGCCFPKEKHLKRHMASMKCHSSLKCNECPKAFSKKNALLKHSFSHLGLLPYTCVRCRCHFRLARLYLRHKCKPQSIHCVACLREFLSDDDFQQHKKDTGCWGNQEPKGDEIRCLECGQRFDTKEDLKKHAGAHQRVLKCVECGKGFRSALLLMSHMGGHAGQSPCFCQSCGLGFPHQQSYDGHLKTCGQTSQSTKAPKKHQSAKRSEQEKLNPAMQKLIVSSDPGRMVNMSISPAQSSVSLQLVTGGPTASVASSAHSGLSTVGPDNSSASPRLETVGPNNSQTSPNLVIDDGSSGTDSTQGCWKLSLDHPPPPGVNLVLFFPVCQTKTSSLMVPCSVPQVLPVPESQVQTFPMSNGLGSVGEAPVSSAPGASLKQETDPQPLDLSKTHPSNSTPNKAFVSIKSEPEEVEVSGEIKSSDNKMNVQGPLSKNNASSRQRQINGKPKSERTDPGLQPSTYPQLLDCIPQKKIKLEADNCPDK